MSTAEEVVIIYAGVRGYLDKVAQKEIGRFETLWVSHVKNSHPDILDTITNEKSLSPATDAKIKATLEEFIAQNEFASR